MAAFSKIFNTTGEIGMKNDTDVISSLTVADWPSKKELDKESEEISRKPETGRLSLLSLDLTYSEVKSIPVRDSETDFHLPALPSQMDESYGSLSSALSYARENAVAHLESITEMIAELKESFDDEMSRQILFFQIKEHLSKLWEIDLPKNDYLLQAVSLLEDSLAYIKSEDLSKEQIEGLWDVVEICKKIELSIDDTRRCGKILRSRKIATLPTLR